MAVGPIGAIAYANQAMPAQTKMQANFQNRIDMQSEVATAIQDADKKEIEDIRPTEETYLIDPDREHEKDRSNQEQSRRENKEKKQSDAEAEAEEEEVAWAATQKHIDIKA